MNNKYSVLAITIGSLFLASCASMNTIGDWKATLGTSGGSGDYEDRLSKNLYATIGIGPSRMEPGTEEISGWDVNDRVEPAGQVTIGMDLTKHLSVEAHSADLGSAGFSPGGRINYHVDGISALLYAGGNRDRFRRQGLKPYGRIGLGMMENTVIGNVPFQQINGTHVLFGAGVEYMTPIGLGIRAEGFAFDKDAKYAQLALMYRTGTKKTISRPKLALAPPPLPRAPVLASPPLPKPVVAVAPPPPPPPVAAIPEVLPELNLCDGMSGVLDGVNFRNNSAELTAESTLVLNDLADELSSCKVLEVEVSAHTDSVGSASYNQFLSEERAASVVDYLRSRGLPRNRLVAKAFGESRPVDTNATKEGRANNRRVELLAR